MDPGDLEAILETTHSAFTSTDAAGAITIWNRAAEDVFGLPRELAIGRSLVETIIPERDRAGFREELARSVAAADNGTVLGDRRRRDAQRADGRQFPAEITISAT